LIFAILLHYQAISLYELAILVGLIVIVEIPDARNECRALSRENDWTSTRLIFYSSKDLRHMNLVICFLSVFSFYYMDVPIDAFIQSFLGIDVGDQFYSRAEMVVLGIHSHWLNGIDFMGLKYQGKVTAADISVETFFKKKSSS
jgi:hypothetical protein